MQFTDLDTGLPSLFVLVSSFAVCMAAIGMMTEISVHTILLDYVTKG
jgi:hypothetical protein